MSSDLFAAPPLVERLFLGDGVDDNDEREGEREDEVVSPAAGSLGIANRCGELAREVGVGAELVALAGPPGAAPAAPAAVPGAAPAEVGVPRAAPL